MKNRLEVAQVDFASAFKIFHRVDHRTRALLAFEGGFLSIEAGGKTTVLRASGEWHGRARFSPNVLGALAAAPPREDPVVITMVDDRLKISAMTIACDWEVVSARFVRDATKPDYLDLLAMDRTLTRSEVHGTGLARRINAARTTLAGRVAKAAKLLKVADIDEEDLWKLVEKNVLLRMDAGKK